MEPVKTISDAKTKASPKRRLMFDKKAKQHLHPLLLGFGAEKNSVNLDQYNRVPLETSGDAEQHLSLSHSGHTGQAFLTKSRISPEIASSPRAIAPSPKAGRL